MLQLSQTDGWEVIKSRLKKEQEEFIQAILAIEIIPENLGKIARFQAQANGASYVLDMVADYINPQNSEDNNE